MTLQRIVLTFDAAGGITARILYRRRGEGSGPGTKARRREVRDLTRTGLKHALEALEGPVEDLGTSGYEVREDVIGVDGRAA